jgi:hypothetical protein
MLVEGVSSGGPTNKPRADRDTQDKIDDKAHR